MQEFKLPFGKMYQKLCIKASQIDQVLVSAQETELLPKDQASLVKNAMLNPIGGDRLFELARNAKTAVIILSDHTRPVPSKYIIPPMLEELRLGNPGIDITLLVATGFHRGTRREELIGKLGEDIVSNEKIVVHDCNDESMLINIGTLPSGAQLVINRLAYEADLLVAEGFIEPHFFAGFSGGRKSVLPGICSRTTILGNHCASFISNPYARAGILEKNPINIDMWAASEMAGLRYIVNVVINSKKEIVAAFAGDPKEAHKKGCEFLGSICRRKARKSPIVIATNGGYPLDQNIYQCVKGMTAAEACCSPGGVIIMVGACNDGSGGDSFHRALKDCESPQELLAYIEKIPMEKTNPDQWEYQILARILSKFTVIFVAQPEVKQMILDMKMLYSETAEEALKTALKIKGKDAGVTIIPDGVSIIVDTEEE